MGILNLTVGLACTVTALLTTGLAIPLLRGKVKRNGWYGVRLSESLESEEAWLRINRYGAKRLILWSLPVLVLGIIGFFVPFDERLWLSLVFGLAPLLVLGAVVETVRYARRESQHEDA